MESKTTLVEVFGGPRRIVQQVLSHPKTITACPLCKANFKAGDSTILVDLVKTIGLAQKDRGDLEFIARIHLWTGAPSRSSDKSGRPWINLFRSWRS